MNIRYLWVIMIAISTVLFLFQVSVDSISPQSSTTLYNMNGSFFQTYDSGNYNLKEDDSNTNDGIPDIPAEVSTDINSFTDIFQFIGNWFKTSKGGQIITGLYYAVPNILKGLGMPIEFSFALGLLWHLLAIFSFVMFMRGVI